jgi:hypothetical protein
MSNEHISRRDWTEFRNTGLLLFVNSFLHIFGWAIVVDYGDDGVAGCYPARVDFRGFEEESYAKAYQNLSQFMVDNACQLKIDADDVEQPK